MHRLRNIDSVAPVYMGGKNGCTELGLKPVITVAPVWDEWQANWFHVNGIALTDLIFNSHIFRLWVCTAIPLHKADKVITKPAVPVKLADLGKRSP